MAQENLPEISKEAVIERFEESEMFLKNASVEEKEGNLIEVEIDGWIISYQIPTEFSLKSANTVDSCDRNVSLVFEAHKSELGIEYREPSKVDKIAERLENNGYEYEHTKVNDDSKTAGYIDGLSEKGTENTLLTIDKRKNIEDKYDVRLTMGLVDGGLRLFIHNEEEK